MMRFTVCFSILVLGVALTQAGPTVKATEKKSLTEDSNLGSEKEVLKIDDPGSDKDRAKKSASFCVEIKPGSSHPNQVPCKSNQAVVQKSTFDVQSESAAQPVQTYSFVQPSYVQSYSVPQASITLPQQFVQPYQSLQVVQSSSQPYAEPTPSVNIIPSVPQTNVVPQTSVEKPKAKPTPAPSVETKERPKLMRIEQAPEALPVPQETLTVLPVAPAYHEHLYAIPSTSMMIHTEPEQMQVASLLQVPSVSPCGNPLHGILSPCPCQNNMAILSESAVEPMAIKVLSAMPYSTQFARSPVVMPYDSKMHIVPNDHMGKARAQGRTHVHSHINVNADLPHVRQIMESSYPAIYQKSLALGMNTLPVNSYATRGLVDSAYGNSGITINSYPTTFRAASPMIPVVGSLRNAENAENSPLAFEVNDLVQTNKIAREIDSSQLPAKMEEIEQPEDDSMKKNAKKETKEK
ncbi:uncharacterized protein LOC117227094 [Megalopta genalis]|uniref:uncharacterized protein LOC117227094 n=1 Tax=Megalopta genalis TaxID=115081 RepID=UPI003FCF782D